MPVGQEKHAEVFWYECHEVLLHNPELLQEDVKRFSALVRKRGKQHSTKIYGATIAQTC